MGPGRCGRRGAGWRWGWGRARRGCGRGCGGGGYRRRGGRQTARRWSGRAPGRRGKAGRGGRGLEEGNLLSGKHSRSRLASAPVGDDMLLVEGGLWLWGGHCRGGDGGREEKERLQVAGGSQFGTHPDFAGAGSGQGGDIFGGEAVGRTEADPLACFRGQHAQAGSGKAVGAAPDASLAVGRQGLHPIGRQTAVFAPVGYPPRSVKDAQAASPGAGPDPAGRVHRQGQDKVVPQSVGRGVGAPLPFVCRKEDHPSSLGGQPAVAGPVYGDGRDHIPGQRRVVAGKGLPGRSGEDAHPFGGGKPDQSLRIDGDIPHPVGGQAIPFGIERPAGFVQVGCSPTLAAEPDAALFVGGDGRDPLAGEAVVGGIDVPFVVGGGEIAVRREGGCPLFAAEPDASEVIPGDGPDGPAGQTLLDQRRDIPAGGQGRGHDGRGGGGRRRGGRCFGGGWLPFGCEQALRPKGGRCRPGGQGWRFEAHPRRGHGLHLHLFHLPEIALLVEPLPGPAQEVVAHHISARPHRCAQEEGKGIHPARRHILEEGQEEGLSHSAGRVPAGHLFREEVEAQADFVGRPDLPAVVAHGQGQGKCLSGRGLCGQHRMEEGGPPLVFPSEGVAHQGKEGIGVYDLVIAFRVGLAKRLGQLHQEIGGGIHTPQGQENRSFPMGFPVFAVGFV